MPIKGQFNSHCKRGHPLSGETYRERACKPCESLRTSSKIASIRAKQKANPEEHARRVREWAKTETGRRSVQNTKLKKEYGITLERKEELLKEQDNKCAVCGREFDTTKKSTSPCVDHAHDVTKRVRGLLCGFCNPLLGYAQDNIVTLTKAIQYLREHSE